MGAFDDIADGVVAAITAGDSEALGNLYADDVVIWHNTDRIEMTKEQNLASLDALAAMTTARSFSNIRRYDIAGGFVQQHVMHLDWGSGSGELPGCLIVMVEDGKITRADEYFDGATIATFGT
jgi:ketosteroid isomerase-like protein